MTPPPLPLPPTDRSLLADFPVVPKEQLPEFLYRVHKVENDAEYFSAGGGHRWDPPAQSSELFGACYTGTNPLVALLETIGDLPLITQSDIDRRAMAVMQLPPEPRWADMTNSTIVGRWGLDQRIGVGDDYDSCQRWAEALFGAGFTGVYYEARHDFMDASVALFGNPGYQPTQIRVTASAPIQRQLLNDVRDICGLEVLPGTGLAGRDTVYDDTAPDDGNNSGLGAS